MGGKGPPRPSSPESDDWGDESWIVDCPCGVNYDDGEEMVECDECKVWVHTACCRVTKGLPTYVCDKCKIKKKLKESEESEVAQLLADLPTLPSKPVSFDERNHEKTDPYITAHQTSSDIPIEERVHVQGTPGGDPSFFDGAPQLFCRQLWKYSGYVPKVLKLEYKELPEPRDDVVELLCGLKDLDVVVDHDGKLRLASLGLENGHAIVASVDTSNSREEEGSKEGGQVNEDKQGLKDKQGNGLSATKGDVRHSKHRHKPKVKEEKPHHPGKRARDEGGVKEQSTKKKPRANGSVCKPEDWDSKKMDIAPSHETGLLCKSPISSPKNPKAMKKLAVQEFMDGDVILCTVCGKVELLLDLMTGGTSGGGGSDSLCQECEKVRRRSSPLSPKQETGIVKQEPVVMPAPLVIDNNATIEVKPISNRELDHYEVGSEAVRLRAEGSQASSDRNWQESLGRNKVCSDSPTDSKKVDLDVNSLHKYAGIHENMKGREEKRKSSAKVESDSLTANPTALDMKTGEVPEALELPAVRTLVAAKAPGESAARAEDLRQDGAQVMASGPSCADDAETRTAGDTSNAVCGNNKQTVLAEGHLPVSSSDDSSKPVQLPRECSTVPVVPSSPGPVPTEPADGNGISGAVLPDRVVPTVVAETPEDRASKFPASTISMETKSQGSARTAGHLPASVRVKLHGDRGNVYMQRSVAGAGPQQHPSPRSGQSLVQFSLCGTPRSAHAPGVVSLSMKGSNGEDLVSGKQHGQAQQECISPVQQISKQGQPSRLHVPPTLSSQKSPTGLSEMSSPSQPSSSAQRNESDQQPPSKAQPGVVEPNRNESSIPAVSPKEPKVATGFNSDTQIPKPTTSTQITPTPVFCQQARQLNGIGHVYVSRKSMNSCVPKDPSGTLTSPALNSTTKLSVSSLKSPSSGTSSSSPTSPLVTTPSSKPQPSVKVPESLPTQKSLSGSSTPNASAPHSSSKLSSSIASPVSSSKQVGALQSCKSIPSPASPQSTKGASMFKQSSRSNSLPGTKSVDGGSSVAKTTSGALPSRGLNHSGSCSKENAKNMTHTSGKTVSKANAQPAGTKPPSSGKSSHSLPTAKRSSVSKQHSGPGSGTAKASSTPSTTKHTASHHSKAGMSHKDEKLSMPPAPPVPKAMSSMPPPPPQASTKRSPPTVLTSAVATTLKDEELALLLHQELNSSPRVPRVPRVRQAGVSLQLVSSPSLSSAKGSFVSSASGGPSHKDRHLASRKRTREDRNKDTSKGSDEVGKSGRKRSEETKMDNEKHSVEKGGHNGTVDGYNSKEKSAENNARHHGFSKGNLSIIVPGNDEAQDGDKKSPAHGNVLTLPGLIDEVLGSGAHQLSYEDVCEAVLPHWPKLRKPNGERYAYPSHRQAVLDCLRNRPAWAHLVGRGPKTRTGRKRRRNDIKSLSDSDDEDNEHLGYRDSDELETGKSFKRRKESDGEKRAGDASERQKNTDAAALEDVRKGGRQVRRRRRVEIEDGTDGEDEPVHVTRKAAEVSKSDDGTSEEEEEEEEEEPEAESSPSSEEEASNYSTDDEEMVVHRGIRNRRRPTDESSTSEDDID